MINGATRRIGFGSENEPAISFLELKPRKLARDQLKYAKDRALDNREYLTRLVAPASGAEFSLLFGREQREGAVVFRYWGTDGKPLSDYGRARLLGPALFDADGKPIKFVQPKGSPNRLYMPPFLDGKTWGDVQGDTAIPVVICEGETRAAALVLRGEAACAIGGVWNWRTKDGDHSAPLPEFSNFNWALRSVTLAFDHDVSRRPDLQKSIIALGKMLGAAGALVQIAELPDLGDGKTGVDDLIAKRGHEAWKALPRFSLDDARYASWGQEAHETHHLPPDFSLAPVSLDWLTRAPPAPTFVLGGYLLERTVGLLVAESSVGKTFVMLRAAMAVATGTPFFGLPVQQGRVVFIGLEDQLPYLRRRIYYMAQALNPGRYTHEATVARDFTKNLTVASLAGYQVHLVSANYGAVGQTSALVELISKLRDAHPTLVILDPLARLHGLSESDNAAATAIVNAAERIITDVGCAVLLAHHTGKANTKGDAHYSARGASAFVDAARSVMKLYVLDAEERRALQDVPPETDGRDILKLVHTKTNHTTKAPPVFLYRSEHGDLRNFAPSVTTAADDYSSWLALVRAWHTKTGQPFSTSGLWKTSASKISKQFSRNVSKQLADEAIERGDLVVHGASRGSETFVPRAEVPDASAE